MKQRTLESEASVSGKALHTGEPVNLTLKPAPVNTGIIFKRIDLENQPEIRPSVDIVESLLVRSTDISQNGTRIHTIEHVLSALTGLGVDNAIVEMDASEPPIMDGSAKAFVQAIQSVGLRDQEAPRDYLEISEPITLNHENRMLVVLPYDGLKVTCTSADPRIPTQHLTVEVSPENYPTQIAPARTFTFYEDIEDLLKMGKIQGGSLECAIVIRDGATLSKEPLRFEDEFVRHKILDIIGDFSLLQRPIKGHIIAVMPGHALNAQMAKEIAIRQGNHQVTANGLASAAVVDKAMKEAKSTPAATRGVVPMKAATAVEEKPEATMSQVSTASRGVVKGQVDWDIGRVLEILPHRYPFLLIDRVVEYRPEEQEIVAIKNVTFNEPCFTGHFPNMPVYPGVLQIETMAQAAGILMLSVINEPGRIAYFMSCDKAKFRKLVIPGDQIIVRVTMHQLRGGKARKVAKATTSCEVDGVEVSSAELMFAVVEGE